MIRRKWLRIIASVLILETTVSIVTPSISYALTSGPTAPEYTSFEPVDTTDMVNMSTGDFVYNLPLLQVPGPGGGFPLSLSYHGGIRPDSEASWVGLGWSLNPGAISRVVSGYPDDQIGVNQVVADHWELGDRNTFSLGVGINKATVDVDVSFDSNKGVGVGLSVGAAFGDDAGTVGVKGSVNTYGEYGVSASVEAGPTSATVSYSKSEGFDAEVELSKEWGKEESGKAELSAKYSIKEGFSAGASAEVSGDLTSKVQLETNFKTASASYKLATEKDVAKISGEISSKGLKGSVGSVGEIEVKNSKIGKLQVESFQFTANMIYFKVGYGHQRFFSDEKDGVTIAGALHADETNNKDPDTWGFDSYALFDPTSITDIEKSDPERSNGGSLPSYDYYNVNAQGISGSIRPTIFSNGTLFRKNVKKTGTSEYQIKYREIPDGNFQKVSFRFDNDFSNSLTYPEGSRMLVDGENVNQTASTIQFQGVGRQGPNEGFNSTKNQLAGSRHVEYFTNSEIRTGDAKLRGFIDYTTTQREITFGAQNAAIGNQIGGFSITNATGVTYHFALPVYAFGDYTKIVSGDNNQNSHEESRVHPYAYTWLLTAVTGADYVDRGGPGNAPNGVLDANDWGYWVKFSHNKTSGDFRWRTPAEGWRPDLNPKNKQISTGLKELYFLSTVETATHIAAFSRFSRLDGKEVMDPLAGGFVPIDDVNNITSCMNMCQALYCPTGNCAGNTQYAQCLDNCQNNPQTIYPESPERLDEITLFSKSGTFTDADAIRSIAFTYDYSLCPETPNSYVNVQYPNLLGKLTLKSVTFRGKGKASLIPSTNFYYDVESPKQGLITIAPTADPKVFTSTTTGTALAKGDIVSFSSGGNTCYATVTSFNGTTYQLKSIGKLNPVAGDIFWTQTKNPPYSQDAHDMWGYYKSDFDPTGGEQYARLVSQSSGANTDVWSLRKIETPTGANVVIDYESDSYSKSVLSSAFPFQITNIEVLDKLQGIFKLTVSSGYAQYLADYSVGDWARFLLFCRTRPWNSLGAYSYFTVDTRSFGAPSIVQTVGPDYLVIKNQAMLNSFFDDDGPTVEMSAISGNLGMKDKMVGGGTRVAKITVRDESFNRGSSTKYAYNIEGMPSISSGVTSFEPSVLPQYNTHGLSDADLASYRLALLGGTTRLLSVSREIPSPGVMYEYVTVSEEIQKETGEIVAVPQTKTYQFEVFGDGTVELEPLQFQSTTETSPCSIPSCSVIQSLQAAGWPYSPCGLTYAQANAQCSSQPTTIMVSNTTNSIKPAILRDYTSRLGNLKKSTVYGADGRPLTMTTTQYLHDNTWSLDFRNKLQLDFASQGVVSELFNEYREVKKDDGSMKYYKLFVRREKYPSVVTKEVTTNYKTGVTDEVNYLAYDFYSGESTKTLRQDAYGNRFMTVVEPAYRIADYSGMTTTQISNGFVGMGLKVNNPSNKHMISQTASTTVYKVDASNVPTALVSAGVETWSDDIPILGQPLQSGIWRTWQKYRWLGADIPPDQEGLYPLANFVPFNGWSSAPTSSQWQKQSEITLYNVRSNSLEGFDVNGSYGAVKMNNDYTKVFATATNAHYDEFAYSGAEDDLVGNLFGGGVKKEAEATLTTGAAHTGTKFLQSSGNAFSFETLEARVGQRYTVSVWSSQSNALLKYSMNDGAATNVPLEPVLQAGSWYLLSGTLPPATHNKLKVWCAANGSSTSFDDFRFHPNDAQMSAFVYNKWDELSHILNGENFYTEYEYNSDGTLTAIYVEKINSGRVKVGSQQKNYAR